MLLTRRVLLSWEQGSFQGDEQTVTEDGHCTGAVPRARRIGKQRVQAGPMSLFLQEQGLAYGRLAPCLSPPDSLLLQCSVQKTGL